MNQRSVYSWMSLRIKCHLFGGLLIMVLFCMCKSPRKGPETLVNQTEGDLLEVQKQDSAKYFRVFQSFKRTAKSQLDMRALHMEEIQKKHATDSLGKTPKFSSAVATILKQIALLVKRLDNFNEEGKHSAESFMMDFGKEIQRLDKLILELEN